MSKNLSNRSMKFAVSSEPFTCSLRAAAVVSHRVYGRKTLSNFEIMAVKVVQFLLDVGYMNAND